MNTPEKIVNTYFRLNGFFLLPQFTLFRKEGGHIHVDLLGLRPPCGQEICEDKPLPIDEKFWEICQKLLGTNPCDKLLGIAVEVKGGTEDERPSPEHLDYAKTFFGSCDFIIPISVSLAHKEISLKDGCVLLPLQRTLEWTLFRFRWMNQNLIHLKKSGSWNWSEDNLADLLYLQKIDFADLDIAVQKQLSSKE
jgi:hypothetical protein